MATTRTTVPNLQVLDKTSYVARGESTFLRPASVRQAHVVLGECLLSRFIGAQEVNVGTLHF